MNKELLKGNWNIVKGKLKQKYAELSDEDLAFAEGKTEEMIGHIQRKTGRGREEVERTMDEAVNSHTSG